MCCNGIEGIGSVVDPWPLHLNSSCMLLGEVVVIMGSILLCFPIVNSEAHLGACFHQPTIVEPLHIWLYLNQLLWHCQFLVIQNLKPTVLCNTSNNLCLPFLDGGTFLISNILHKLALGSAIQLVIIVLVNISSVFIAIFNLVSDMAWILFLQIG